MFSSWFQMCKTYESLKILTRTRLFGLFTEPSLASKAFCVLLQRLAKHKQKNDFILQIPVQFLVNFLYIVISLDHEYYSHVDLLHSMLLIIESFWVWVKSTPSIIESTYFLHWKFQPSQFFTNNSNFQSNAFTSVKFPGQYSVLKLMNKCNAG